MSTYEEAVDAMRSLYVFQGIDDEALRNLALVAPPSASSAAA